MSVYKIDNELVLWKQETCVMFKNKDVRGMLNEWECGCHAYNMLIGKVIYLNWNVPMMSSR